MWKRIAFALVAVSLIAFVELTVGWGKVMKPWIQAPPLAIGAAALLLLTTYLVRSARLFRYFRECRGIRPCMRLFLLHNLLVTVLPLHAGDVSFPVLMKRYFSVSFSRSVPGLLWLRYLDFHTLLLIGLFSLWLSTSWSWLPAAIVAWVAVPILTVIGWEASRRVLQRRDSELSATIVEALDTLPTSRAVLLESWGWTTLNWGIKIGVYAWILTIFSPIKFIESLLGATGGELSLIMPVKLPAAIGTYEAGVVAAVTPLGVRFDHALSAAVNLHMFGFGVAILTGLVTFLIPRYAEARRTVAA